MKWKEKQEGINVFIKPQASGGPQQRSEQDSAIRLYIRTREGHTSL